MVLLSILLPGLDQAKEMSRRVLCLSTLRGMVMANQIYADDNDGFCAHGVDMEAFWGSSGWDDTGYGRKYLPTYIFDDDWWDSKPGVEGRNLHGGGQNICSVGQLMWGNYLPEQAGAIACPQSDYREDKGFNAGMKTFSRESASWSRDSAVRNVAYAWRNEDFSGNPSYTYISTTYVVRGPLVRMNRLQRRPPYDMTLLTPTSYALFADHEQMSQNIRNWNLVANGQSPLKYYGRTHRAGVCVGYVDGRASLFPDADRRITYWGDQTWAYGNGYALYGGTYDQ